MASDPPECPHCRQRAPTVVRGVETFCVACGAPRLPLAGLPVNLAGRTSKLGGSIARVLGWGSLAGGLAAALVIGALLQAIFPAGVAGWIVGGVIAAISAGLGTLLLVSGKKLHSAGAGREREVALQAISALAARKGGAVTVEDVQRALGLSAERADALLTDLAKLGDRVRLEVDDSGQLLYFVDAPASRRRFRVPGEPKQPAQADGADEWEAEQEAAAAERRRQLR